jgi:hypothetical protein
VLKVEVEKLLRKLNVVSVLDCACGDFNWMKYVSSSLLHIQYLGGDIVQDVIDANKTKYNYPNVRFQRLNIVQGPLPKADLVLCRDCLVHLSMPNIMKFFKNFVESKSSYLLMTSFTGPHRGNANMAQGVYGWDAINFQKPPFNFPMPVAIINEQYTEMGGKYTDKSLLLWTRDQICQHVTQ